MLPQENNQYDIIILQFAFHTSFYRFLICKRHPYMQISMCVLLCHCIERTEIVEHVCISLVRVRIHTKKNLSEVGLKSTFDSSF